MATSQTHATVYLPTILLDSTNYTLWFFHMESFLHGQNLFSYVDGTLSCPSAFIDDPEGTPMINPAYIAWRTQDKAIVNMIGRTLSLSAVKSVVGCSTSHDVWTKLRLKFAAPDERNVLQLKANFQKIKKGSDSIDIFLDRIKEARDVLETVGVTMDDKDVVVTILSGLPPSYNYAKSQIRANLVHCSLDVLKVFLQSAEADMADENSEIPSQFLTAMVAQKDGASTSGISSSSAPPSFTAHDTGISSQDNSVQTVCTLLEGAISGFFASRGQNKSSNGGNNRRFNGNGGGGFNHNSNNNNSGSNNQSASGTFDGNCEDPTPI